MILIFFLFFKMKYTQLCKNYSDMVEKVSKYHNFDDDNKEYTKYYFLRGHACDHTDLDWNDDKSVYHDKYCAISLIISSDNEIKVYSCDSGKPDQDIDFYLGWADRFECSL